MAVITLAVLLMGTLVAPSCALFFQTPSEELSVSLTSDQAEYLVGEPVQVVVAMKNTGHRALTLPNFDFSNPGSWERVMLGTDGITFAESVSHYGGGREFASFELLPGESKAYEIALHRLGSPLLENTTFTIRVELDLGEGKFEDIVVGPNGEPEPKTTHLSFTGKVVSNEVTIRIQAPSAPADIVAHELLLAHLRSPRGLFSQGDTNPPIFAESIVELAEVLVRDHPSSRYTVHARFFLCRRELTELAKHHPEQILSRISAYNLGVLEDDALLLAYQLLRNQYEVGYAERVEILQRLKSAHEGKGANQLARAIGYIR